MPTRMRSWQFSARRIVSSRPCSAGLCRPKGRARYSAARSRRGGAVGGGGVDFWVGGFVGPSTPPPTPPPQGGGGKKKGNDPPPCPPAEPGLACAQTGGPL